MSTSFRSFRTGRLATVGAGAGLLLAAVTAHADPQFRQPAATRWETAFSGNVLSVEVQVDGHTSPLYRTSRRDDRRYFEAQRGEEYALRIRNHTGRRTGVLISVDGLNVVNGERSALASSEPMYVLEPWAVTVIRGWRTSLDQVREFVFVDEERSYASRTGQANGDLGWIRVLAFEEQPVVSQLDGMWRHRSNDRKNRDGAWLDEQAGAGKESSSNAPAPGKAQTEPQAASPTLESRGDAAPRSKSFPGTGWGDRRHDPVRETWFDPQSNACDQLVLRYEYARGLADLGIFRDSGRDRNRLRDRDRGEFGFAQPPRR